MASKRPNFIDSPYYVDGKLKPGAPAEVRKEYEDFMENDEMEDLEVPKLTKDDLRK